LKKFSAALISLLLTASLFCGCSDDSKTSESASDSGYASEMTNSNDYSEPASSHNSGEDSVEPDTQKPSNHELERDIKPAEGTYVYDYAKLLNSDDFSECNNYAELLYENFLINVAVVTTDDIEELTPEQYAEDVYNKLYGGRGSGFLLLINNDTNQDYIYKTGGCLASVPDEAQSEAFYWATQDMIGGNFKDAVMRLLKLAEYCPQHVFDNGGVFNADQSAALESSCTSGTQNVSVLATSNSTGKTNEEICRSYYNRRYGESGGYMIMLDTETKTITAVTNGELPAAISEAVTNANTLSTAGSYIEALNAVITAIQG